MSFTFTIIKNEMQLVSQTKLVSNENIQVLLLYFYLFNVGKFETNIDFNFS